MEMFLGDTSLLTHSTTGIRDTGSPDERWDGTCDPPTERETEGQPNPVTLGDRPLVYPLTSTP